MDAFEQLVSEILWMEGYWVRTSVKVDLTKEEKHMIGRPSSPRWELDIVAYSGRDNLLRVVECKSYLDSPGVRATAFDGSNASHAARYKLFNDPELNRMAQLGYENQVSAVVAKLLLKGKVEPPRRDQLTGGDAAPYCHRWRVRFTSWNSSAAVYTAPMGLGETPPQPRIVVVARAPGARSTRRIKNC
jgi:hypothetical protein